MEIDIFNYLHEEDIIIGLKNKTKKNTISFLIEHLIETKKVEKENKKEILKVLLQREEIGSTAIGGYIAFPHARLSCIKEVVLCLAISDEGVDFDALDEELVNVIVLLLSNQKEAGVHLKLLAYLAKLLRDKSFVQQLKNAKDSKEVMVLISRQAEMVE
ncbi:MAG: PTS sugar transporter subunit IIA [Candidatus Omnitrophica bacterium]|nr:PTS sugar transporter subunit IIA [Candidatus Omnitrophota bacterium]